MKNNCLIENNSKSEENIVLPKNCIGTRESNTKVSIIIPVFNSEKYLDDCLRSCVEQTLNNIEIIVVNDASTDNSSFIMSKFENLYPEKIKCINLKENHRQGGARNIGIKEAQGEYLCFVDSDDFIDPNMCNELYQVCSKGYDIVGCYGYRGNSNDMKEWRQLSRYDFIASKELLHFTSQCWMLIKRSIITDNDLFYPERIFHEDTAVVPVWYSVAKSKTFIEKPYYFCRTHEDSTTASMDAASAEQILQACFHMIKNFQRVGLYEEYKAEVDAFILARISVVTKFIENMDFSKLDYEKLVNSIRNWRDYQFNYNNIQRTMQKDDFIKVYKLINGVENLDRYLVNQFEYQNDKYNCMVDALHDSDYEIVLWGIGKVGKRLCKLIQDEITDDFYIGDNNIERNNSVEKNTGKMIRNFDWIMKNLRNPIFVISSYALYFDIKHSLISQNKEYGDTITFFDITAYIYYGITVEEAMEVE